MMTNLILTNLSLRGFRFLLPPLLTLFLGKLLFELFVFNFSELNELLINDISGLDHKTTLDIKYSEIKARLLWATSVFCYLFICAGFAAFIWHTLSRILTARKLLFFIGIAAFFSITEIAYLILVADRSTSPLLAIFGFTYNALVESGVYTNQQVFHIQNTLNVVNLIAILVTPYGIMTGCCIMQQSPDPALSELDFLHTQSKHLKDLLIGGSAVMVIGLIHMKLWLSWPLCFVTDDELLKHLDAITLTISQYWGVTYTLIIAALYMPAAIYLSEKARNLIILGDNEELKKNPEKWLIENKMLVSPTAQLPQLVTILSPMLVGSFGSTLGNLIQF